MVFANRTHIHWVNQNQKEHHIMPLANITEAKYVDFDPVENMIYWSDVHHGGSISKASLCAQGKTNWISFYMYLYKKNMLQVNRSEMRFPGDSLEAAKNNNHNYSII